MWTILFGWINVKKKKNNLKKSYAPISAVHSAFKTLDRTTHGMCKGECALQCLCIISSIIVQIHPSPHFPAPTMPEQWCSNKAIRNDEHTFIALGEEWRLWSKCTVQCNKHTHLTSTDGHILQMAFVINTLAVMRLPLKLCN